MTTVILKDKRVNEAQFWEVNAGEFFTYGGELYLRIYDIQEEGVENPYQAVNLRSGDAFSFARDCIVEPVKSVDITLIK